MATIKSYTDIEQSKKLAKILPLESADMVLLHEEPYETSDSKFDGLHQVLCVPFDKYDKSWRQKYKNISYFPCWSLASLLSALKIYTTPTAFSTNMSVPSLTKTKNGYSITYVGDYRIMESNNNDIESPIEIVADNPVDACFKLIIKLKEMNLI
jgi:hypothetical protein